MDRKTCVEHALFLCNKCLSKEVDRMRNDLVEARMTLATVGNIIGGPVAAISEELRSEERAGRIERAGALIAEALAGPGRDMRELLADWCHSQWSGWMVYMFGKCETVGEDELTVPLWACERWRRQMLTPYKNLSETEQESDRKEADKLMALLDVGVTV